MIYKLAVIGHNSIKKNEIAVKTVFYKKKKSGRQVLKNVY